MRTLVLVYAVAASLVSGVVFAEPFSGKSTPAVGGTQLGQDSEDESEPLGLTGFKEIDENYFEAEPMEADSSSPPVRIRIRGFNDSSD
jgi:hypothetical protein